MISYQKAHELFNYNPLTGLLTHKTTRNGQVAIGQVAGRPDKEGYIQVAYCHEKLPAHRIAFLMWNSWLPAQLDHKNLNKSDNRIENLRPASAKQNQGNQPLRRNNTSGFKGVSRSKDKWAAFIVIDCTRTYLGRHESPEFCARLYDEAAKVHFGEYAYLNFPEG